MPMCVRLKPELTDHCPFCGGNISFGSNPAPFAMHSFPFCKKFMDLDVVEFLHAVNVEYAKTIGGTKPCASS